MIFSMQDLYFLLPIFFTLTLINSSSHNLSDVHIQSSNLNTSYDSLKSVISILKINGHSKLVLLTPNNQDQTVLQVMDLLIRESDGTYSPSPRKAVGSSFKDCSFEGCVSKGRFRNAQGTLIADALIDDHRVGKSDTLVFLVLSYNESHLTLYLNKAVTRKVLSCAIIMMVDLTPEEMNSLNHLIDDLGKNAMFYLIYLIETEGRWKTSWYRVITLSGYKKAMINSVQFNDKNVIKEHYDLGGIHIRSLSLSWTPYFLLSGCNENGKFCKSEGYLSNLMDELGRLMNFTWESHQEVNNDWGLNQYQSGGWGGVVGNVFNGTYQLSIRY